MNEPLIPCRSSYIKDALVRLVQILHARFALLLVALSRHPFAADVEAILQELLLSPAVDHLRWFDHIANGLGHLLIVLVDHESVHEDVSKRSARLHTRRQQQRRQEPAVELIVSLAVQIRLVVLI